MTKLDELIKEYCPNGVEHKKLGELGRFYGGITGKSKDDFKDGNAKFITYKNVYSNPALDINIEDRVRILENENQRTIEYGDIIFTGSSETPDECGISSVLTVKTKEKLYLNSFCFVFRFDNPDLMLPDFSKHLFRSDNLRYQIGKTANGVTRFNVSKGKMAKVIIPIPPIEVQREIVRILDNFTGLTTKLTAELTARKKQYEYCRDELLSFDFCLKTETMSKLDELIKELCPNGVEYIPLSDKMLFSFRYGKGNKIPEDNGGVYDVYGANGIVSHINEYNCEDVTIIGHIGTVGLINRVKDKCFVTYNGTIASVVDKEKIDSQYFYYVLTTLDLPSRKKGSQPFLSVSDFDMIKIPVPPLEVQREIVRILDNFTELTTEITTEIESRQKQYEYYRDKLLSFDSLS